MATGDAVGLAASVFHSNEYLVRAGDPEEYVADLYRIYLNRRPAPFEPSPWVGLIVGGVLGVADAFVTSGEFRSYNSGLFR